jgi:hypothetical protein
MILGKRDFLALFVDKTPLLSRTNRLTAVLWVFITLVTILMYGRDFLRAPLVLILLAAPLATLNGLCEGTPRRGLYDQTFPNYFRLAVLYPAIGFALWHLVPLQVFPEGSQSGFVLSTFFLGLAYGFIACKTGSAKGSAISHSLNGILALSGMLASSVLRLLGK